VRRFRIDPRTAWVWSFVAALPLLALAWLGGASARSLAPQRQDDPAVQATATREAELAQIADLESTIVALQTQVALLSATSTPTPEPTPVPPVPAGQALPYGAGWSVTALDAGTQPLIADLAPVGVFIAVRIEVTNLSDAAQTFPFRDFRLRDAADRVYAIDQVATTRAGPEVHLSIDPTLPQELLLVFDVLPDAGETFVLESTEDPTFRVQVMLAQRG
jgi:hypothetical protein